MSSTALKCRGDSNVPGGRAASRTRRTAWWWAATACCAALALSSVEACGGGNASRGSGGGTKSSSCEPIVCESEGVFPSSLVLASTSDGAYWLAYRFFHYTEQYAVEGINTQDCWQLEKRTVKSDVVLIRVSPDGSSARSTRWSYSVTTDDGTPIAMTARGSRLFLAIANHEVADIFILDSAKL